MRVYGALFWNLSPLINVTEPPRVYVGSFRSLPFSGHAIHHDLFEREEISLLRDLYDIAVSAIEMKLALVRQHAIRVLVHAELVSAYITAYKRAYGFFKDANSVWTDIVMHPQQYVFFVIELLTVCLNICWYQSVSNHEVWRISDQPPLTSIIQKRCLMLFGHLARMDESADARRILTAVRQFPRLIGKGRQDVLTLSGWPNKEELIISQPQHGRCH